MNFETLETPFLNYPLLQNLAVFPGTNDVGNGSKEVGTTLEKAQADNRQVPIKAEVEHLDTNINDEDFYQQSNEEPDGTNRIDDQNVANIMPDWLANNDTGVPCYEDIFLPTALNAAIKVEMADNASQSVVDAMSDKQNADQPSMLLDPMLSEMDVSSLIPEVKEIDENIDKTDDSPGTLRRSTRKRSFAEVFKIDIPVKAPAKRRRKLSSVQKVPSQAKTKVADKIAALKKIVSVQVPSENSEEAEEKVADKGLKIVLKKSAPVNPVDKHRIGNHRYRKGLITSKHISASLYFSPAIKPKVLPEEDRPQPEIIDDFDAPNKRIPLDKASLELKNVKDTMRKEWIENHNLIANYRAHGQKVLDEARKKLTPDGNAVRGSIAYINLDNIYDKLLDIQESIIPPGIRLNSEAGLSPLPPQPLAITNSTPSPSGTDPNLDNTFLNEFNFENDYFENDVIPDPAKSPNFEGITGAVRVDKRKLTDAFLAKHTVFNYNGEFYMLNPVDVTVLRTPDELIKKIMSTPKKASFENPFYSALITQCAEKKKK